MPHHLSKNHEFEIAGGSVTGTVHCKKGVNNQDSYLWYTDPLFVIGVVCDGCSAGMHSEVGAWLGAHIVIEKILRDSRTQMGKALLEQNPDAYFKKVHGYMVKVLKRLAGLMGRETDPIMRDYYLFTIVGVIVLKNRTYLFSIGDGLITVNGDLLPPYPVRTHMPDYIAYSCFKQVTEFKWETRLTAQIDTILLATDGAHDLHNPNHLFDNDLLFKNPDAVRRHLMVLNRKNLPYGENKSDFAPKQTHLPDDTTLILIRRQNRM